LPLPAHLPLVGVFLLLPLPSCGLVTVFHFKRRGGHLVADCRKLQRKRRKGSSIHWRILYITLAAQHFSSSYRGSRDDWGFSYSALPSVETDDSTSYAQQLARLRRRTIATSEVQLCLNSSARKEKLNPPGKQTTLIASHGWM
jgi:hypothetical protein